MLTGEQELFRLLHALQGELLTGTRLSDEEERRITIGLWLIAAGAPFEIPSNFLLTGTGQLTRARMILRTKTLVWPEKPVYGPGRPFNFATVSLRPFSENTLGLSSEETGKALDAFLEKNVAEPGFEPPVPDDVALFFDQFAWAVRLRERVLWTCEPIESDQGPLTRRYLAAEQARRQISFLIRKS